VKKSSARKPAAKGAASSASGAPKLDRKTLNAIRARLTEELEGLREQQAELEEDSFDSTQSDMTGEVGMDEDFADAGTATFDRERDLSIRNNISDLIDQVTRALQKIDEGTYGTCEHCGRPINEARLQALPHALLCMDCKRRDERAR
jgi:RNA polymerase-binding protein DksA